MKLDNELLATLQAIGKTETAMCTRKISLDETIDALKHHTIALKHMARKSRMTSGAIRNPELKFISAAKACNVQRIKVLANMLDNANPKTNSYMAYRKEIKKLQARMAKRALLSKPLGNELFSLLDGLNDSFKEHVALEDAVMIDLLIAISHIDGEDHRNEKRVVRRHYRAATKQALSAHELTERYSTIDTKVDDVLKQLKTGSVKIFPEVKKRMFFAAIHVAIADHKLLTEETQLLLKVKHALNMQDEAMKQITEPEHIVKIVRMTRRVTT